MENHVPASSLLLAGLFAANAAATQPTPPPPALNPTELSLVCLIKDWTPPTFIPQSDAARANLSDADRKYVEDFEQGLSNKAAERDDGNLSQTDFDRYADRSLRDAIKARSDLRPVLSSIAVRYSHNVGVDYLLERDNERALAQHDASTQAKPYLNHYVSLRYANNAVTWQETMNRIVDKAPLGQVDPRTGLTPTLGFNDGSIVLALQPKPEDTLSQKTVATFDRYSGEIRLDKNSSAGRLLYSLSGLCSKQEEPKF